MRHSNGSHVAAALLLAALVAACAATNLPPISTAGSAFKPFPDEQELWEQSRHEEEALVEHAPMYSDPQLESYLDRIVTRLNPPGMAANPAVRFRVRVIEDPTLNAFAFANGGIFVHTGLLARLENEDQIATVLGHEMTHVENRHMLRFQRSAHNKEVAFRVASVAVIAVGNIKGLEVARHGDFGKGAAIAVLSDVVGTLGLRLAQVAAVNGYGRSLETEADQGGFAKMAAAGYDLRQAPRVYEVLLDDHKEPRKVEAFFFGNHPLLTERIANSKQYLAAHPVAAPPQPAAGNAEFARLQPPLVREDARLNIYFGRYVMAAAELDRARAAMPKDWETRYLTGQLKFAQIDDGQSTETQNKLLAEATGEFREAVKLDPNRPLPHRALGLVLLSKEERKGGCSELRRYLKLAPQGKDNEKIHGLVAANCR
ncbi:MAG TPA: M48 family metalloprotease [Thermoanaerobaculia bacterium]|nr:M48 family metalloprotease [Thermoanaerobaculia bacterium]